MIIGMVMMTAAGARGELNQDWMRGDSALKGAMLSVLLKGPCHGYALARRLNRLLGPTWGIEAKSLYPRLDQLEREGLLESGEGSAADRMAGRVVYTPTERAEAAVADWIGRTGPHPPVRSELYAKIVTSSQEHAPALLRALDVYEVGCLALLRSSEEAEVGRVSWAGVIMNVVRAGPIAQIKAELDWVRAARQEIIEAVARFPPG